ncbi:MAG: hypothetical protein P1P89_03060 [Desulfobacterales bacterium]|nr:hypothetical protein [Desulfobacterales bacterium]
MEKSKRLMRCVIILLLLQLQAAADGLSFIRQPWPPACPEILPVSQERALEERADQVIEINDALIQRTVQANGGNYFRQGQSKVLIFNHKIYKDFSIRVIGGNRLSIETEDGTFQMDVLNP